MKQTSRFAKCKHCGEQIINRGTYWEHTGIHNPRHPAQPDEAKGEMTEQTASAKSNAPDLCVMCGNPLEDHPRFDQCPPSKHPKQARLTFAEYQAKAHRTAIYPRDMWQEYLALGVASEAGEIAGKFKKIIRDEDGKITEDYRAVLKGELGDVLWYVTQLATELRFGLDEIAEANLTKLLSRQERSKLQGDGDDR